MGALLPEEPAVQSSNQACLIQHGNAVGRTDLSAVCGLIGPSVLISNFEFLILTT